MSKKINKLTPEQEAMIPVYLQRYLDIGRDTTPCNREKAEDALTRCHQYQKLGTPKFIWVDSPMQGQRLAAQIAKGSTDVTDEEVAGQASKASYGSFEAYWVAFYAFIGEQLPVEKDELLDIVKDIVVNCGVYWTFEKTIVISDKPTAIRLKEDKLHNPEGLALEYKNGDGIFALEGVRYPSMLDMAINEAMPNSGDVAKTER